MIKKELSHVTIENVVYKKKEAKKAPKRAIRRRVQQQPEAPKKEKPVRQIVATSKKLAKVNKVKDTKTVFNIKFEASDPVKTGKVCIWNDPRYKEVWEEVKPFRPMTRPKASAESFNYFEAAYRVIY